MMDNHFAQRLAFCIRAWFSIGMLLVANAAHAQVATRFDVTPPLAAAGAPRQVTVTLPMLTGCEPTGVTVVPADARHRTATIQLDGGAEGHLCTSHVFLYSKTVELTPDAEGDMKVVLISNDGRYAGETVVHTRSSVSTRSQYDLTGMWFDPATAGSGLTFIHGATGSDAAFGTWYVYDGSGAPRWYSVQNFRWSGGGSVADGQIFETHANAAPCNFPGDGCPIVFSSISPVASMHLVMQGANSARVQAISPDGVVLFTSNIVRSIF